MLMPLETMVVKVPMPTNAARNCFSREPLLSMLLSIRSSMTERICCGSFSPKVPEAKFAIVTSRSRSLGCGVMVDISPVRAMDWNVPTPSMIICKTR